MVRETGSAPLRSFAWPAPVGAPWCTPCRDLGTIGGDERAELGREGLIASDATRRVIPSRRHQPVARVAGDAVAWPPVGGDGERLLCGFPGEVELAEEADQGGQDAASLLAEDLIERRYQ